MLLNGDCLEWKPIKGFEHYLVSSSGLIFNTRRNAIKKSGPDHKGYLRVRLIDGSKGVTKKVHRLVAEAFLNDFSSKPQVNHKDCNKQNNHVSNLEMVDQSENTKHAWVNRRMKLSKRDTKGRFIK